VGSVQAASNRLSTKKKAPKFARRDGEDAQYRLAVELLNGDDLAIFRHAAIASRPDMAEYGFHRGVARANSFHVPFCFCLWVI
jgi:hypothetical protein